MATLICKTLAIIAIWASVAVTAVFAPDSAMDLIVLIVAITSCVLVGKAW